MKKWIDAHRKALIAAVAAVLALVLNPDEAQVVAAAVGVVLTYLVPNDSLAVSDIYGRY